MLTVLNSTQKSISCVTKCTRVNCLGAFLRACTNANCTEYAKQCILRDFFVPLFDLYFTNYKE